MKLEQRSGQGSSSKLQLMNDDDDENNKKRKGNTTGMFCSPYCLSTVRLMVLAILCLQNSLFTVLRRYSQGVLQEVYSKVRQVYFILFCFISLLYFNSLLYSLF